MEHNDLCRIVIRAQDLEKYLGISNRNARRLIEMVRNVYGRRPSGMVTIREFCTYHEFDYGEMMRWIREDGG